MAATYKLRTKIDSSGAPLLALTVRVEHELIVDGPSIQKMTKIVQNAGEQGDLTKDEKEEWLLSLASMKAILSATNGAPAGTIGLQTDWLSIPSAFVDELTKQFAALFAGTLRIYAVGQPPNSFMVLGLGRTTVQVPVAISDVPVILADLKKISDFLANPPQPTGATPLAAKRRTQSKPQKPARRLVKLTDAEQKAVEDGLTVLKATLKVTVPAVACAATLTTIAVSEGVALPVVGAAIGSCAATVQAIKDLSDAAAAAASAAQKAQLDRDFERVSRERGVINDADERLIERMGTIA